MTLVDIYESRAFHVPFRLLQERRAIANISHRVMPTWEEHHAFVSSRPYEAWYVITGDSGYGAGAIYLSKQREIGVGVFFEYQRQGLARAAILELMRLHPGDRFLANVAPENHASHRLFESLGAKPLQVTYAL